MLPKSDTTSCTVLYFLYLAVRRTWHVIGIGVILFLVPQPTSAAEEAAAEAAEAETEAEDDSSDAIVSEKDEIALVKDSSVAEAVKRRPDLTFANVQIDGESSGVSLSSISADAVESVEVMKAVTPDQDAESRGGSISLKTRPNYAQKKIVTKLDAAIYFDSLDESTGYRTRITSSGPLNKAKTWGASASIGFRDSPYSSETLYQDWQSATVEGKQEFVLKDTGFGKYERSLKDQDISLALDYKANDSLNFFWRATVESQDYVSGYQILKYRFYQGDYVAVDDKGAEVKGADIRNSFWQWDTQSDHAEAALGGVYETDDLLIDFKYTYKDEESEYTDYLSADFVQGDVDLRYKLDELKFPTTQITNARELNDASAYEFEDLNDRHWLGAETDAIGALNLKWTNPFGHRHMFLKAGMRSRSRENHRISNNNIYDAYDGSFTLSDVLSDRKLPDILEGRYRYDTIPDSKKTREFFENNKAGFEFNERRSRENSDPNSYTANEQVDGYYAMLNIENGKWRSTLGVRQEKTNVDFLGNEVILGQNELGETIYKETNPAPGNSSYDNLFPNAHFRYKWSDTITLIGSYTNTIARPSYTYLVPSKTVNLEEREIDEGNPNLKPTLYTNYDLSVDVELPTHAMLSVEFFDRSVEDFIFSRRQIVASGIYQGFELDRFENSSSAEIQGATVTWRQSLEGFMLPDGLSLNANYTSQKSEMEYPARPGEILPLTYTPDNELKLTFTYQGDKIFAQVRYAYDDLRTTRIAENSDEDGYYLPTSEIDLSLTYELKKHVSLFADLRNVTNEPSYERYEGSPNRPAGFRHLPWTMTSGVRVEL